MNPFSSVTSSSTVSNSFSTKKKGHSPRLSPRLRSLNWRPRTPEEIARKKNCKVISQHLKRIGKAAGRELSLDQNGVCCFTFKKFVVVVEVPEDNSDICLIYSKVCHVMPQENVAEVKRIMGLYNDKQHTMPDSSTCSDSTCQASDPLHATTNHLAMKDDEEITLIFAIPIHGISFQDTADHLERFAKTAVIANRRLNKAKILPAPIVTTAEAGEEDGEQTQRGRRPRMWSLDSQTSISEMSQCGLFSLFVR